MLDHDRNPLLDRWFPGTYAVTPCSPQMRAAWVMRSSLIGLVALAAGCSPELADPFARTGELIAMSGGAAGPANACFTCHGLRGEGNGADAPAIAGLSPGYLVRQINDYAAGLRKDEAMGPIAKALDSDARRAVSDYYGRLAYPFAPASPHSSYSGLYQRGDPARGLAACASCHGPRGEGVGDGSPPIAGQPVTYLSEQLDQWKAGRRRNDPRGQMIAVTARLSPAEIDGLSAYVSRLGVPPAPAPVAPAPEP